MEKNDELGTPVNPADGPTSPPEVPAEVSPGADMPTPEPADHDAPPATEPAPPNAASSTTLSTASTVGDNVVKLLSAQVGSADPDSSEYVDDMISAIRTLGIKDGDRAGLAHADYKRLYRAGKLAPRKEGDDVNRLFDGTALQVTEVSEGTVVRIVA